MATVRFWLFRHSSLVLATLLVGVLFGFRARAQPKGDAGGARNAGRNGFQVPGGTVLPVRLNHGFSSKNARVEQVITARITQDIPLPNGGRVPEGAKILGTILSVSPAGNNIGGKIAFRFDQLEIHHRRAVIVTNLRAIASLLEVEFAQIPETSPGFGTPYIWATTDQIGRDVKYGVREPVTDKWSHTVGEGTYSGALVHIRAQPGTKCRGAMDAEDRPQALWVFSADACGAYGMNRVRIEHAGRTADRRKYPGVRNR